MKLSEAIKWCEEHDADIGFDNGFVGTDEFCTVYVYSPSELTSAHRISKSYSLVSAVIALKKKLAEHSKCPTCGK